MRAEQLVLDDAGKQAIKNFRDSKPWQGSFAERLEKFNTFYRELAAACAVEAPFEFVGAETGIGNGGYDRDNNRILLVGKLSVVTLLYCFAILHGLERGEALAWAKGLFRHYFPRSFRRCSDVNGVLRKNS
jgi:hypothetical protein